MTNMTTRWNDAHVSETEDTDGKNRNDDSGSHSNTKNHENANSDDKCHADRSDGPGNHD